MAKRHKMSKRASQQSFRRSGSYTHKKNMPRATPMRGGIRL